MRLQKLKDVLVSDSWDEEANASKNEEAFAELIQFLDDKSLAQLTMEERRCRFYEPITLGLGNHV